MMVALSSPVSSIEAPAIRMLTAAQLPEAAKVAPLFFAEGRLPGNFVPEVFVAKWSKLIELDLGFIIGLFSDCQFVGGLGAIVAGDLNDGDPVANECFWFVHPDHRGNGLRLLVEYEAEARRRGCTRCSMIHLHTLHPERLGELYIRRGYRAVETSYFKELN